MTYAFNLEWNELPEQLRDEKIDMYIESNMAEYKESLLKDINTGEEQEDILETEVMDNELIRVEAEKYIAAHFPIYF